MEPVTDHPIGGVYEVPVASDFDKIVGYYVPIDPATLTDCDSCQ